MSLQQGLNQLLGGASALLSLNPQVQAGGAEQSELRKLNKQEALLAKQEQSSTAKSRDLYKAQQDIIKAYGDEANPIAGAVIQGAEDAYTSAKQETSAITKEQEDVARSLFKLNPTQANMDKLMHAKAMSQLRGNLANQIKQREEFRSFWHNLEEATKQSYSYNMAQKLYKESTPKEDK